MARAEVSKACNAVTKESIGSSRRTIPSSLEAVGLLRYVTIWLASKLLTYSLSYTYSTLITQTLLSIIHRSKRKQKLKHLSKKVN